MSRLWMLRLVPALPAGRWLCATTIFIVLVALLNGAGGFYDADGRFEGYVTLFFCVILAYIVPVFHFITVRTEEAFDALLPLLPSDPHSNKYTVWRDRISCKSWRWVAVNLTMSTSVWLLQSWVLTSFASMTVFITSSIGNLIQSLAPLFVWMAVTCAIHALIDNALLFRRLTRMVPVDVLDAQALTPFGHMAVSSVLAVIGTQASFSIMWLGDVTNPWTTIPGMVPTTAALLMLFFAPVWPIHKRLKAAKVERLRDLQARINAVQIEAGSEREKYYAELAPLLAIRREVVSTHEWPFDLSLMARLSLYLIIVPLTWIGAALIENLVDFFVA